MLYYCPWCVMWAIHHCKRRLRVATKHGDLDFDLRTHVVIRYRTKTTTERNDADETREDVGTTRHFPTAACSPPDCPCAPRAYIKSDALWTQSTLVRQSLSRARRHTTPQTAWTVTFVDTPLYYYLFHAFTFTRHDERKNSDRTVLRRRVRVPGQARRAGRRRRRRRDQRLADLHEEVRQDQRGTGAEQRPRVGQPSQVFPQRRPVRPTVQRPEEWVSNNYMIAELQIPRTTRYFCRYTAFVYSHSSDVAIQWLKRNV